MIENISNQIPQPQPQASHAPQAQTLPFAPDTLPSIEDVASIEQQIADARAALAVFTPELPKTVDEATALVVSGAQRPIVNALLARRLQLRTMIDKLTRAEESIKSTLSDMIEQAEKDSPTPITELVVDGAVVFTYAPVVSRVLNQPAVKSLFPDTPENAEFWKDQESRPRKFK